MMTHRHRSAVMRHDVQQHPSSAARCVSRNKQNYNHNSVAHLLHTTSSVSSSVLKRRCRSSYFYDNVRDRVVDSIDWYGRTWIASSRIRRQLYSVKTWHMQQHNQSYRLFSSNSDTNISDVINSDVRPPTSQLRKDDEATLSYHSDNTGSIQSIESNDIATTTTRSSAFFENILSKIDATATTSDDLQAVSPLTPIVDWDKDVLGTTISHDEKKAVVAESEADDNLMLQKRIKEVNETRQKDILKRQSKVLRKCHKNRRKQYTTYSNTEQAIEAARMYAQQTNHSTVEEIQNWMPYTEQDVKDLFIETYTQKALFNMKDMKEIMAQYDHAIYNTSLLVLPSTTTDTGKPLLAISNYPKSSLKLLTLLKGMHNRTNSSTHPIESLFIKFVLHRNSNQQKEIFASDNLNDKAHQTDVVSSNKETASLSSFDTFLEIQKDENDEWNDPHSATTISTSLQDNAAVVNDRENDRLMNEEMIRRTDESEQLDPSKMPPSGPNHNCYHQSHEEYLRMTDALDRLRETLYVTHEDKRMKQPRPAYRKVSEKTICVASHLAYYLPNILFINLIDFLNELESSINIKKNADGKASRIKSIQHTKMSSAIDKFYFHFIASQLSDYLFQHDDTGIEPKNSCNGSESTTMTSMNASSIYNYHSNHSSTIKLYKGYTTSLDYFVSVQSTFVTLFMDVQAILYNGSRVIVLDQNDETCKKIRKSIMADCIPVTNEEFHSDANHENIDADAIESKLHVSSSATDGDGVGAVEKSTNAKYTKASSKITNQMVDSMDESSIRPIGFRKRKVEKERMPVSHLAFEAISLELNLQSNYTMNVPIVSVETPNETFPSSSSISDDVHQQGLNGHSGHYLNGSRSVSAHHNLLSSTSSSPYSRMVFIDNLPIDICSERLNEVYSRCGEIESVEIFNQRPDLDPGKLAKVEIMKRRAKQTKMSLSSRTWSRPKTPVYGLLTFANEAGYEKAIDASLRIFGMIIQRHPVRSIPSWCMNTLYIEDVPTGHPCIDLEYQLSYALEPNNIFVCLNAGQNYTSTVGSCEIKFPTFEIAHESYKNLQEKLNIFEKSHDETTATPEGAQKTEAATADKPLEAALTADQQCRINWIASQKDAHKWWTRQYGFD